MICTSRDVMVVACVTRRGGLTADDHSYPPLRHGAVVAPFGSLQLRNVL